MKEVIKVTEQQNEFKKKWKKQLCRKKLFKDANSEKYYLEKKLLKIIISEGWKYAWIKILGYPHGGC